MLRTISGGCGRLDRERANMTIPALDSPTEQTRSISLTVATQRDRGLQMRLFAAQTPGMVEAEVDLRVSDELAGMYYIG